MGRYADLICHVPFLLFLLRTYHHLSPEDRAVIMIERQNGNSLRSIARRLGRSPSTLSRELRRAGPGAYDATQAAKGYRERRGASRRPHRLIPGTALYQHVHDRLVFLRWSPQQIAARLRQMSESERPGLVSHETIYTTIYAQPRGALKQGMVTALRQAKPARGREQRCRTKVPVRTKVPWTITKKGVTISPPNYRKITRPL
jgi:IS30 family transposase